MAGTHHSHDHGHHHDHVHDHAPDEFAAGEPPLDPASQSLADALRRSFGVLKVLMVVLVVLYFLSGIFTVKPGERAVVMRFGDIVGKGTPQAVKEPGWHWSLPFPIDSFITVNTSERELDVSFMLQLTDEEIKSNTLQAKYSPLSPERDDYVVTGDANILHVALKVKYRVSDVVDYVTNVYPAPDRRAGQHSPEWRRQQYEYAILRNLARDAVIATAARFAALDVRGDKQDEFLLAVAGKLNERLAALERAGRSLGIAIDPNTGVIAPKSEVGNIEAIMPPPQTKDAFDQVFSAETKKTGDVTRALTAAKSQLVETAGEDHAAVAAAIDRELELMREHARAVAAGRAADELQAELSAQRSEVERLLLASSGQVQSIVKEAQARKHALVQEAESDYQNYLKVLPEYLGNPKIFMARFRDEARARAIARREVVKVYVPEDADTYWLKIPRDVSSLMREDEKAEDEHERMMKDIAAPMVRPTIR